LGTNIRQINLTTKCCIYYFLFVALYIEKKQNMTKNYDNKAIRAYIRANRHYTDQMVADHFNVSTRVIAANKAHITMGKQW